LSVEKFEMLVKSSRILTLPSDRIPRFQIHNEQILGAEPISQNQIQIFAKTAGTTQVNLWDTEEKLYTIDVTVLEDARELEGILSSQLPLASIKVTPIKNAAIISGTVTSVDDVDRAIAIAEQFYPTIVNNIKVIGVQQVLLHTRIMEVSRTKLRDLGIDWGTVSSDAFFFSAPSQLLDAAGGGLGGILPSAEASLSATNRILINGGKFEALITALRKQDLVKLLAEPTVVATHGRPARFNVGGRVPYIVPTGNNSVAINYEEYGTAVDFLPFVVGPGRIRLEVRPEVTEPDNSRSISASGIQVPAFSSRYVETAVELQAGQTFAIAGLLQSRTEAVSKSTPFFGELPLIGSMFRRVREQRNDIELLITVTPELVDAMDPEQTPLGGPGLNSMSPNDRDLYRNGHIEVPNQFGGSMINADDCLTGNPPSIEGAPRPKKIIVPTTAPVAVGNGVSIESPGQ
jgi:pilus assembly protein CpaC